MNEDNAQIKGEREGARREGSSSWMSGVFRESVSNFFRLMIRCPDK